MIELLGWVSLAFGGGYFAALFGAMIGLYLFEKDGLAAFPPAVMIGSICALSWVCFVFWQSPIYFGVAE
jgi:hypothetical protein